MRSGAAVSVEEARCAGVRRHAPGAARLDRPLGQEKILRRGPCGVKPGSSKIIIVNVRTIGANAADEVLRGPVKSKTIFPALILHLLAQGPEHGYGLLGRIETICSDLLAVNTNTIYPLLHRLEERGFISGEWDHPVKRSRRLYRITPAGRERLERIKATMLPYLESLAASIDRLRGELYAADNGRRVNHG
jgi:PadR family transcriptional regulator PadR